MQDSPELDVSRLPAEVRETLAQLELELSEGDITEKGFKKKRDKLVAPFLNNTRKNSISGNSKIGAASPSTNTKRRQRRLTRNESRYHSEIRQEAVQQALADWKKEVTSGENKYVALQPIRRKNADGTTSKSTSIKSKLKNKNSILSDSSSDDDDSTLDSCRGTKVKPSPNAANKPLPKSPVPSESNNNHQRNDDAPKPLPRLLRHRSRSRDRIAERDRERNTTPIANGITPMQRVLNEENRLRKQNKRSSQIFGVEPTYVSAAVARGGDIGDRALPIPPIEEPEEEAPVEVTKFNDDDAAYVNCTYTNDSGLGSATGVPVGSSGATNSCQDYANTHIPLRPAKVSAKIQQIMQSLQVGFFK